MAQDFARKEYIQQFMTEFEEKPQIAKCYWKQIAEAILDDVVKHINKNADPNEWDEEDVRRAIGSVICERLGI